MEPGRVEVIAGVNLPMLIKLSGIRKSEAMATVIDAAQAAGRKYINVASQMLSGK
jgi:PTS system mannose-specific IIA component